MMWLKIIKPNEQSLGFDKNYKINFYSLTPMLIFIIPVLTL